MSRLFRTRAGSLTAVLGLIWVATASVTAGFVAARPAYFFGVDGKSLGYSVARETGGISLSFQHDRCVLVLPDEWECMVSSDGSGALEYKVHSDGRGCWKGRRAGGTYGIEPAPRRASGCIGMRDYLRLGQRVLGTAPATPR
jgi:hypothetical protein